MKTILVLTDLSRRAEHAAGFALEIARKSKARIHLFHAFYVPQIMPAETGAYPYFENYSELEKGNRKLLKEFAEKLEGNITGKPGFAVKPEIKWSNAPGTLGETIEAVLHKEKPWMIVMGEKRRNGFVTRLVFGSDVNNVIDKSRYPVLLVPDEAPLDTPKKIAFATDFTSQDYEALSFVIDLADLFNAELMLAHVQATAGSNHRWQPYKELIENENYPHVSFADIKGEKVAAALTRFSERTSIDLLALVHKHHHFWEKFFRSSTTEEMLDYHQKTPLLILPSG